MIAGGAGRNHACNAYTARGSMHARPLRVKNTEVTNSIDDPHALAAMCVGARAHEREGGERERAHCTPSLVVGHHHN